MWQSWKFALYRTNRCSGKHSGEDPHNWVPSLLLEYYCTFYSNIKRYTVTSAEEVMLLVAFWVLDKRSLKWVLIKLCKCVERAHVNNFLLPLFILTTYRQRVGNDVYEDYYSFYSNILSHLTSDLTFTFRYLKKVQEKENELSFHSEIYKFLMSSYL